MYKIEVLVIDSPHDITASLHRNVDEAINDLKGTLDCCDIKYDDVDFGERDLEFEDAKGDPWVVTIISADAPKL